MRRPSRTCVLAACLPPVLAGCTASGGAPAPAATGTLREQIAALALGQVAFGSVSLLPVRFENSRIAGPIEDGGRTLYCVTSQMKGRSLGKPERPKLVVRAERSAGRLTVIDDDEACTGHRGEPFPELERLGNPA